MIPLQDAGLASEVAEVPRGTNASFAAQIAALSEELARDDVDLLARLARMSPAELEAEEKAALESVARGIHIHSTIAALRMRRAN